MVNPTKIHCYFIGGLCICQYNLWNNLFYLAIIRLPTPYELTSRAGHFAIAVSAEFPPEEVGYFIVI